MRRKDLIASVCVAALAAAPACAIAQTTTSQSGSTAQGDKFIRLDSRTGAITDCSNKGSRWACTARPDERWENDNDVARLEAENARLKSELVKREATGTVPPPAKSAEPPPAGSEARNDASRGEAKGEAVRSEPATPARTASVEPAARGEGQDAPPAAGNVAPQLPQAGDVARKDGFLSRAWQQLLDLARIFSRN